MRGNKGACTLDLLRTKSQRTYVKELRVDLKICRDSLQLAGSRLGCLHAGSPDA